MRSQAVNKRKSPREGQAPGEGAAKPERDAKVSEIK